MTVSGHLRRLNGLQGPKEYLLRKKKLLSIMTGALGVGIVPVSVTAEEGCRKRCSFLGAAVVGCRVQGGQKVEQGEAEKGGEGGRREVVECRLVGSVDGKRSYSEYRVVASAGDVVGGERSTYICVCA